MRLAGAGPEDNIAPPAHNPVYSTGPYFDFEKYTLANRGYTCISRAIIYDSERKLEEMFERLEERERSKLANLVMTGGARPLHMCGMSRGANPSQLIRVLIKNGADVNAKDNYGMTPLDRLRTNDVHGCDILRKHGAIAGRKIAESPQWDADEYVFCNSDE